MGMTFDTLSQTVIQYANRSDTAFISEVPLFIENAQLRISQEAKTIGLEAYATGNLIPGQCVYPKPNRWIRNIAFNIRTIPPDGTDYTVYNPLLLRSYEYINLYAPDRTVVKLPLYYGDYGFTSILVGPTPDLPYPFEWPYIEQIVPIDATNQTNWLTDNQPNLLQFATLLEASFYLKDDERTPMWQQSYQTLLAALNQQDQMRMVDRMNTRQAD